MEYLQYGIWENLKFNTHQVLNLIINGIPSIQKMKNFLKEIMQFVLNLIINGIPSILW